METNIDDAISLLASMSNAVIKNYACDHRELLADRVQTVADDIEMFLSKTMPLGSPAAATFVSICFAWRVIVVSFLFD